MNEMSFPMRKEPKPEEQSSSPTPSSNYEFTPAEKGVIQDFAWLMGVVGLVACFCGISELWPLVCMFWWNSRDTILGIVLLVFGILLRRVAGLFQQVALTGGCDNARLLGALVRKRKHFAFLHMLISIAAVSFLVILIGVFVPWWSTRPQ
jgi:hypothetical protein